ncbi:hypothetical protein BHC44_03440 [Snodgrassella alvi]|nr:hypothetical protein BHC44_03440 [Snodgrassella alvi]
MLLSALHVSTPTLAFKHWLNGALYALNSIQDTLLIIICNGWSILPVSLFMAIFSIMALV